MTYVSNDDLIECMALLKAQSVPFVVVTVIGTRGSTPRKIGAKMIVSQDGRLFGTVGGGVVEGHIIEKARLLLKTPKVERFSWDISSEEAGGARCGGFMEFLMEPFMVKPKVFIFGGGHVGHALARILDFIKFDITVVDYREEVITEERFPMAKRVLATPQEAERILSIPEDAFCVVTNPSHTLDLETMRFLIKKPLKYLGLMASKKKRKEIFDMLQMEGVSQEELSRVKSPVGLDIGAETPEEIAISIAGQMIEVLRKQ